MTQTETFIRKPFRVEAVVITRENIEEIAPTIGKLRFKENGEPWVKADRNIIPNVRNVFIGFVLTDVHNNKRCYSPKAFAREFMPATEEWLEYIQQLDTTEEETEVTHDPVDAGDITTGTEAAETPDELAMEELPTVDPSVTEAAEAAMAGMTADERAVVEDHLAIPGVGEALAESLAKGDIEEVLPTEEERAAASERMAKVQEGLGIPDLSEERAEEPPHDEEVCPCGACVGRRGRMAEEVAESDGSETEDPPHQGHGVVCTNCGSKNLTPVGRGYSCNGCGHHEVNLDGAKTEPRNVFDQP
jgi:hypothetical protein